MPVVKEAAAEVEGGEGEEDEDVGERIWGSFESSPSDEGSEESI